MKFRKKPVEVEAIQYLGTKNCEECHTFMGIDHDDGELCDANFLYIETLEGQMEASTGDWIIKGIQGEFYPCKPDIFELTYEQVKE